MTSLVSTSAIQQVGNRKLVHARARTTWHQVDRSQIISDKPLIAGRKRKRMYTAPAAVDISHFELPAISVQLDLAKEMDAMFNRYMQRRRKSSIPHVEEFYYDAAETQLKRQKRIKTRRSGSDLRIQARQSRIKEQDKLLLQEEFADKFVLPTPRRDLKPVEHLVDQKSMTYPPRHIKKGTPLFEYHTKVIEEKPRVKTSVFDVVTKYLSVMTINKKSQQQHDGLSPLELVIESASPHVVQTLSKMSTQKLEPSRKRSLQEQVLILNLLTTTLKVQNKTDKEIQAVRRRASKVGVKKTRKNPLRTSAIAFSHVNHSPAQTLPRPARKTKDDDDYERIERRKPKERK